MKVPKHYDNINGSLYKVAEDRGWNSYLFDIVKRLERSEKKGEFIQDLEKSKLVIDLWIDEQEISTKQSTNLQSSIEYLSKFGLVDFMFMNKVNLAGQIDRKRIEKLAEKIIKENKL